MIMTLVFSLAMAFIAYTVLSRFHLTPSPTHPSHPAVTAAPVTRPDRCPSTNGQLRSCDEDEAGFSPLE
jgi:hypothetical protein